MINNYDFFKLPGAALAEVAAREKTVRRKRGYSQVQLAEKAGVSLGSLRRFEQTGKIAFESLVSIMFALGCADELDRLFARPAYSSIQEVIDDAEKARRTR
ncbi:MAG: helix-turn-helix transcriptional regulator [Eggerthellaceae bacterium]|nr:helix-turn-helix transcriptional regulator [Eggerthellaceae bacterium]